MKRAAATVGGIGNALLGVDRRLHCVREGMLGVCRRVEFHDAEMWYLVIVQVRVTGSGQDMTGSYK